TKTGEIHKLEGHLGPVLGLAFGPPRAGKPLVLFSAAREWDFDQKRYVGGIRAWDVSKRTEINRLLDLPDPADRFAKMFSWHEGPALKETCLAFVWGDGKLKRWRLQDEKERPWPGEAGKYVYFTTRLMHASSTSASCLTGSIDGDGCGQIKVWDL